VVFPTLINGVPIKAVNVDWAVMGDYRSGRWATRVDVWVILARKRS
jgi:hypothetical protein